MASRQRSDDMDGRTEPDIVDLWGRTANSAYRTISARLLPEQSREVRLEPERYVGATSNMVLGYRGTGRERRLLPSRQAKDHA